MMLLVWFNISRRIADKLGQEKGFIIPLFAVCAILIVLFGIAYQIDIPTIQAAAIKGQRGLDQAALGALQLPFFRAADNAAYQNAMGYFHGVEGSGAGRFFKKVEKREDMEFVAWIPRFWLINDPVLPGMQLTDEDPADIGPSQYLQLYDSRCAANAGNCASAVAETPQKIKDYLTQVLLVNRGTNAFSFRDTLVLYAKLTPHRYLPKAFLSSSNLDVPDEIELMTIAIVRPVMTYILVDTAFPTETNSENSQQNMRKTNFTFLFGGSTDDVTEMWPLGTFITDIVGLLPDPTSGDAPWPNEIDGFTNWIASFPEKGIFDQFNARGGAYHVPDQDGFTVSADQAKAIHRFYSGMCDNLPFFYFKDTIVNLIDRFARISAAGATAYIGLVGPTPDPADPNDGDYTADNSIDPRDHRIIPLFPLISVPPGGGNLPQVLHPSEWGKFGSLGESGRIMRCQAFPGLTCAVDQAFNGYVDSSLSAPLSDTTSQPTASGRNFFMNLCGCRAYYTGNDKNDANLLSRDEVHTKEDNLNFSHCEENDRRRAPDATNWCDDSTSVVPDDQLMIDYDYAHPGNPFYSQSQTARNLVAGLGIRVVNEDIPRTNEEGENWTRPLLPDDMWRGVNDEPDAVDPSKDEHKFLPGESFLPYALRAAVDVVSTAATGYRGSDQGQFRPLARQAVVYFGFRPWSDYSLSLQDTTERDALSKLEDALMYAACERQTTVILSFLILDSKSRDTYDAVRDRVRKFEIFYNRIQEGALPTDSDLPDLPDCDENIAPVYLFASSYNNPNFPQTGSARKNRMRAAANFRSHVPETIYSTLFSQIQINH